MSVSREVRNTPSWLLTNSETPSHVNCFPPSEDMSTRRTTHSASRTTIRAPGATASLLCGVLKSLAPCPGLGIPS